MEPYRKVLLENKQHFSQLTALIKNPAEIQELPRLGQLFDSKLKELGKTIQLAKSGNQEGALAIVLEGRGRRYTQEFQHIIRIHQHDCEGRVDRPSQELAHEGL